MVASGTVRLLSIPLNKFQARSGSHVMAFFTPDRGQIRSMVRTSRGKGKSASPLLPFFTTYEILFAEPRRENGLYELKERETRCSRPRLNAGSPMPQWAAANLLSELLYRSTETEEPHPYLFRMFDKALDRLERGAEPNLLMTAFLVKFLEHMGYRPRWEVPDSPSSRSGSPFLFDPSKGGLCTIEEWNQGNRENLFPPQSCRPQKFAAGEVEAVLNLRSAKFEDLPDDSASVLSAKKWMPVLVDYVEYHLEIRLKSFEFWTQTQP